MTLTPPMRNSPGPRVFPHAFVALSTTLSLLIELLRPHLAGDDGVQPAQPSFFINFALWISQVT